jgi:hypothetical protein
MSARVLVALVALLQTLACGKRGGDADPPEATPTPTPTMGQSQGRVGGKAKQTGASGGEYDEPFGKNKEPVNIMIDNQCSNPVTLFYGKKPAATNNFYVTMNGRAQSSVMMMPGDRIWLMDDEDNGLAHADVDAQSSGITIASSCTEIWAE